MPGKEAKTTKKPLKKTSKRQKSLTDILFVRKFHVVLVSAAFATLGLAALTLTQAKSSPPFLLYGGSSCPNGVWTVDAQLSVVSGFAFSPVDIYDTSDTAPTGYRLLKQNISLPVVGTTYTFSFNPITSNSKDEIIMVPTGSLPYMNESVLIKTTTQSVCGGAPTAPVMGGGGGGRHGGR
jgi:hypothetical protein